MGAMKPTTHTQRLILDTGRWLNRFDGIFRTSPHLKEMSLDAFLIQAIDHLMRLITDTGYRLVEDRAIIMEYLAAYLMSDVEGMSTSPYEMTEQEIDRLLGIVDHLVRDISLAIGEECLDPTAQLHYEGIHGHAVFLQYVGQRPFAFPNAEQRVAVNHQRFRSECEPDERYVCL